MRRMRWWALALVWLVAVGSWSGPAYAHSGGMGAILEVTPAVPPADADVPITITMLDVLGAPVPGAQLTVSVRPQGQAIPAAAAFHEESPAIYLGQVHFPRPGMAVLRVEAVLPDGLWFGEVAIRVGPDGYEVNGLAVTLNHQDSQGSGGVAPGAPGAGLQAPVKLPPLVAVRPAWYQVAWVRYAAAGALVALSVVLWRRR